MLFSFHREWNLILLIVLRELESKNSRKKSIEPPKNRWSDLSPPNPKIIPPPWYHLYLLHLLYLHIHHPYPRSMNVIWLSRTSKYDITSRRKNIKLLSTTSTRNGHRRIFWIVCRQLTDIASDKFIALFTWSYWVFFLVFCCVIICGCVFLFAFLFCFCHHVWWSFGFVHPRLHRRTMLFHSTWIVLLSCVRFHWKFSSVIDQWKNNNDGQK